MGRRAKAGGLLAVGVALTFASVAPAHVERPSYWPDPKPDCSIAPCAGGAVPTIRPLATALPEPPKFRTKIVRGKKVKVRIRSKRVGASALPGITRVVCQPDSLTRAQASIADAIANGYVLRPTLGKVSVTAAEGKALLKLNKALFKACKFSSIQAAVDASHNNDRVVIMPGVYVEPDSRARKTNDPSCSKYLQDGGGAGHSYRYQWNCPNDQSLINIMGRALGTKTDSLGPGATPNPPLEDRHGYPDLGACIRCNLQIEGSGVKPEDVAIDAGDPTRGNAGPSAAGTKKDVAVRADRADGLVLRNFVVRHAKEHDVYVLETDGYVMDRVKFFYAGEYGHLTFASDHGLTENCEAAGSGDAGVYPGGAPDTGAQTIEDTPRYNQEITRCDVHHNGQGLSGTMGNAILIDDNDFYDNSVGINTDSLYPGGHPGYPQDSGLFIGNRIFSNNFSMYAPGSDVMPDVYAPTGTGILTTGGNDNRYIGNWVYDNWRRGEMMIGVPNAISEFADGMDPGSTGGVDSTSYGNLVLRNHMGVSPEGKVMPNGVDFWWDEFPGNTGNRWCNNTGINGAAPTSDPPAPLLPGCDGPSIGLGNALHEAELLSCGGPQAGGLPSVGCNWGDTPPKPGTRASQRFLRASGVSGSARDRMARIRFGLACGMSDAVRSGLALIRCAPGRATVFDNGSSGTAFLQGTKCAQWRAATPSVRTKIIHSLAGAATTPDPETYGPTLPETLAYDLFQRTCAQRFARSFSLYQVYNRAASFQALGSLP
jgi:hypothetical protein